MCVIEQIPTYSRVPTLLLSSRLLFFPLVESDKILTRSMRFLRTLPTGNHSRVERRVEYMKDKWEPEMRRGESSSKPTLLLRSCEREKSSDMKQIVSAVTLTQALLTQSLKNAGIPFRIFVVVKHQTTKDLRLWLLLEMDRFLFLNAWKKCKYYQYTD